MPNIWRIISLFLILFVLLPIILWAFFKDHLFGWVFLGSIFLEVLLKLSRFIPYSTQWHKIVMRPDNARNCSILNTGGSYKGKIGMPSGHVSLTTFSLLGCLIAATKNGHIPPQLTWILTFIVCVLVVLMVLARIFTHCHTVLQTLIGALLGGTLALLWV